MTQRDDLDTQESGAARRRGRRPAKPFPAVKFEDVLILAGTIIREAVGDQMRRLTLFDRLKISPDSGTSKQLVAASARYGLTRGTSGTDFIAVTDDGREIARFGLSTPGSRLKAFNSAIQQFEIFNQLYDKLKDGRLPAEDVLSDEFSQLGVEPLDCHAAASVFVANIPPRRAHPRSERCRENHLYRTDYRGI